MNEKKNKELYEKAERYELPEVERLEGEHIDKENVVGQEVLVTDITSPIPSKRYPNKHYRMMRFIDHTGKAFVCVIAGILAENINAIEEKLPLKVTILKKKADSGNFYYTIK